MIRISSALFCILFFLTLTVLPSLSQSEAKPANKNIIYIINTGSTNTRPFRIRLNSAGTAKINIAGETTVDEMPNIFVRRLIGDLKAAQPLASLASEPCIKSVSFGSQTYIEYRGERTPDIDCMNAAGNQIRTDVNDILLFLNIDMMSSNPIK